MRTITIELGNVHSEIISKINEEIEKNIHACCSYKKKFYDKFTGSDSFVLVSLFNQKTKTFPTGLHVRITDAIIQSGYDVEIKDSRENPINDFEKVLKQLDKFGYALRDYQIEGFIAGIENPHGLFNWCTGAGKSVLFASLLNAYDTTTLIMVNRLELRDQIASEIKKMTGRTVGLIGDGEWRPSKWTVGIVNTLNRTMNGKQEDQIKARSYLETIKYFIGDEIHHLGADTWKEIAKACKNANIRHGFSGTCFHADSEDLYLVAYTGEIISDLPASRLIKQGWLATPHISMPSIGYPGAPHTRNWHEVRKKFIRENKRVNESGVDFLLKHYNAGRQCIYFAGADVGYGKNIYNMLMEAGVVFRDIKFMSGQEDGFVRKKVMDDYKNGKVRILGGTSIYDEGIDVPLVDAGANFGQGFSEISTRQRIGRVIRKKKISGAIDVDPIEKQIVYYWDPYNTANGITEKHSQFRKEIYESERGFKLRGKSTEKE